MIVNDDRTITLEPASRPCALCYGRGLTLVAQPCPTGGRGPRGGKGGCRTCHGSARHYDSSVTETCARCGGVDPMHAADEDLYDHVDIGGLAIEWRVVDETSTRFTEVGMCLGERGAICTTIDYGWNAGRTDDDLVADARGYLTSTQAVNVVRKADMRLADALVVVRRSNGYSVVPAWDAA